MPVEFVERQASVPAVVKTGRGFPSRAGVSVLLSAILLIPCFWHSRIQAGDLGSHVYNAWLAQLINRGDVTGLTVVRQWNNVLFDILLVHAGSLVGWVAAEKILVSFAVLLFFWGAFWFLTEVSGRPPWVLTPILFALAYGYVFNMGFMNYYLSIGLAFLALTLAWRGGAGNWIIAFGLAAVSLVAHPFGFLFFLGLAGYMSAWRILSPRWRLVLPAVTLAFFVGLRIYFALHDELQADWRAGTFLMLFGQDQLKLFGVRYAVLSAVVLIWIVICCAGALYDWALREIRRSPALRLAFELYVVTIIATICLPENFRTSIYAAWVGLLVSRLTLVSAVFGLLTMASLPLPSWSVRGFAVLAGFYFFFMYQDTGKLDRLETNARALAENLPTGTRVVAVANPPGDWRIVFIYHSIDRACIGHCFSFANYEPSSTQFRVRALPGSFVASDSSDKAESMSSGDYIVHKEDLPLTSIYQCSDGDDFTRLCALPLRAGQKTEDPESEPLPATASDPSSDRDSQPEN